jgi:hypothetical protein
MTATGSTTHPTHLQTRFIESSNYSNLLPNVEVATESSDLFVRKFRSFGGLPSADGTIYSMVSRRKGINWNQFYGMKLLKSCRQIGTQYRVNKNGGSLHGRLI